MPTIRMHADEVDIDVALVGRLIATQFPHWAGLSIEAVRSAGTDHALYRLGDDMVLRLPRIPGAVQQVDKEHRWLPRLDCFLPLDIPVPIARATPGDSYPWNCGVYRWLAGESATVSRIVDPAQAAKDLANFIAALHRIDPTGGPAPGPHNSGRGVPLIERDMRTRTAIAELRTKLDADAVKRAWDKALRASAWQNPGVWVHGDLQSGNLLVQEGRLSAVIDFGCLGVGDPACDLMVAWNFFSADWRAVFRHALEVDDAMWMRGRGWALSVALIALPYYWDTNRTLAEISRYAINEVLADHAHGA